MSIPTISDRLNEIICRYRIDSGFPEFQKYCEAVKLISSFFERFTDTDTVMLIATKATDLKYLRSHMECAAIIEKVEVDFLKSIDKSMFESNTAQKVVVISYTGHREVCHELSLKGIPHESLYEYFAENGLILQHDYYDFILSTYFDSIDKPCYDFANFRAYREIYYEKKAYALAKGDVTKSFRLKRVIFLYLHIKDFLYAKKYIDEYVNNGFLDSNDIKSAWSEIEQLLTDIKNALSKRTGQDTIMFWLDGFNYGGEKSMPFLDSLDAISFGNAYAASPFTRSSLQTILTGKKLVDESSYKYRNITGKESPFIRQVEEYGARFLSCEYVSGGIHESYHVKAFTSVLSSITEFSWAAIQEFMSKDEPLFVLTYERSQMRRPYISAAHDSDILLWRINSLLEYEHKYRDDIRDIQKSESFLYADRQIEFYCSLLPESMNKIFMSDHGYDVGMANYERYHTFLKIQKSGQKPARLDGLFTYLDWHKLIGALFFPEKISLEDAFRSSHVEIQAIDFYSKYFLEFYYRNPKKINLNYLLGHRGIITRDEFYVRRNDGYESFHWMHPDKNRPIPYSRLRELREMSGDFTIDPRTEPRFNYAAYLYEAINRYLQRTKNARQMQTEGISRLFASLRGKNVAIYTGNEEALYILKRLYPDMSDIVSYVIDNDKSCVASYFGVRVLSQEEAENTNIDVIVIPFFEAPVRMKLQNELAASSATVIDLYEAVFERARKELVRSLISGLKGKKVAVYAGEQETMEIINHLNSDMEDSVSYVLKSNSCLMATGTNIKTIPSFRTAMTMPIEAFIIHFANPELAIKAKNKLRKTEAQIIDLHDLLKEHACYFTHLDDYQLEKEDFIDLPAAGESELSPGEQTESIFKLFSSLEKENKVVALRTGGYWACNLLNCLFPDLIDTVNYIVDIDLSCPASNFGIEVLTPDEAMHKPIDVFVIPQNLLSRSEITSELAESSAQVIDLQDL